ncbi:uncharacterized protein BBA_00802 [Beauveria bassiana ARSEF 2860]|uniref:Uncharacterized protein n=1 Tax=Beauveria bassiana (strain ARSEF 2860) TaxID=655819 RepID=J5K049_BEAB2|nr:uncharacterized protein BBA_00802 [Beauveria bassiana ARSEF 2860]EJP69933.1 hypothetical protein BBA_00802 [Beauveria bassiana ARSEF 2860]
MQSKRIQDALLTFVDRRVRREDLGDSGADLYDTIGHDEAMQARVRAQIAAALGLDDDDEPSAPSERLPNNADLPEQMMNVAQVEDDKRAAEQGYEFNLFSTAGPGGTNKLAKVILEDENELLGDGAFLRRRPCSYYVAKAPSAMEKEQYRYAAVTADTIVQWSTRPSWGVTMPWRVITTSATRKARPGDKPDTEQAAKRKRPGKKQRILLRQRTKKEAQTADEAAKKQTEKAENLKEKKKRLNRIKKLRKRAKEKEKKVAAGGEADGVDTASDSGGND